MINKIFADFNSSWLGYGFNFGKNYLKISAIKRFLILRIDYEYRNI